MLQNTETILFEGASFVGNQPKWMGFFFPSPVCVIHGVYFSLKLTKAQSGRAGEKCKIISAVRNVRQVAEETSWKGKIPFWYWNMQVWNNIWFFFPIRTQINPLDTRKRWWYKEKWTEQIFHTYQICDGFPRGQLWSWGRSRRRRRRDRTAPRLRRGGPSWRRGACGTDQWLWLALPSDHRERDLHLSIYLHDYTKDDDNRTQFAITTQDVSKKKNYFS